LQPDAENGVTRQMPHSVFAESKRGGGEDCLIGKGKRAPEGGIVLQLVATNYVIANEEKIGLSGGGWEGSFSTA